MSNFKKNTSSFRMHGKSPMTKSPTKMYGKKSPAKKYKSDAQRKAVHASKADKK